MRIRIESRDCVIDEGKEGGYLDLSDSTAEALEQLAKIGRVRIVSAEQQAEWARSAYEAKVERYEQARASYAAAPDWSSADLNAPTPPDLTSFKTYLAFETDYD